VGVGGGGGFVRCLLWLRGSGRGEVIQGRSGEPSGQMSQQQHLVMPWAHGCTPWWLTGVSFEVRGGGGRTVTTPLIDLMLQGLAINCVADGQMMVRLA
jgi:hypothetical protein